eukprot:14400629-Alexandrium_andersonii.AAC.1
MKAVAEEPASARRGRAGGRARGANPATDEAPASMPRRCNPVPMKAGGSEAPLSMPKQMPMTKSSKIRAKKLLAERRGRELGRALEEGNAQLALAMPEELRREEEVHLELLHARERAGAA